MGLGTKSIEHRYPMLAQVFVDLVSLRFVSSQSVPLPTLKQRMCRVKVCRQSRIQTCPKSGYIYIYNDIQIQDIENSYMISSGYINYYKFIQPHT